MPPYIKTIVVFMLPGVNALFRAKLFTLGKPLLFRQSSRELRQVHLDRDDGDEFDVLLA